MDIRKVELIRCPYDPGHTMPQTSLEKHMRTCRTKTRLVQQGKSFSHCKFNHAHIFENKEALARHEEFDCSTKLAANRFKQEMWNNTFNRQLKELNIQEKTTEWGGRFTHWFENISDGDGWGPDVKRTFDDVETLPKSISMPVGHSE